MKNLTPNQYWLLQHQITAFWHEFGIANGLQIPRNQVNIKNKCVEIKPEYMQSLLKNYIEWLTKYKKAWNSKEPHPNNITTLKEFLNDEKKWTTRKDIFTMIDLLQNNLSLTYCLMAKSKNKTKKEKKKPKSKAKKSK